MTKTSWEPVEKWYDKKVGTDGHYYHQNVIIPGVLRLLKLNNQNHQSLLDIACGQGVLARHLPKNIDYTGIDAAPSFIKAAQQYDKEQNHQFIVGDATKDFPLKKTDFTFATILLALQNIEHPLSVFKNAQKHLKDQGKFLIILNHPCFRIPRQSSWGVDPGNATQYRRIDSYMSSMKIPIQTHPSKQEKSTNTWSFHYPLSSYFKWLNDSGFKVDLVDEWCSDKVSTGKAAKMENRSREEIPMFLAILATKV